MQKIWQKISDASKPQQNAIKLETLDSLMWVSLCDIKLENSQFGLFIKIGGWCLKCDIAWKIEEFSILINYIYIFHLKKNPLWCSQIIYHIEMKNEN